MTTVIVFILILSLLIFVHELGHFVTAKKAGIVVEEFGIGYPPRAVKLWQDEGKITLDGHEFIIGRKTKVPKNMQVGGVVSVSTLSRPDGRMEVTEIEVFDPEKDDLSGKITTIVEGLEKPTEYTLNWIPFGGFVKMLGEEDPSAPGSFASKSKKVRFTVLVAGAMMNLITAVIVFTIMFFTGQPEPVGPTYITDVAPNSPAAQAGIQSNDIVLKADDTTIESSEDLVRYTRAHRGEQVTLTLLRDGGTVQASLVPRKNPPPGEGSMGIGIFTRYTRLKTEDVTPNSPAAKAGLQSGDILLTANDLILALPEQLNTYLDTHPKAVKLTVQRGDRQLTLDIAPETVTVGAETTRVALDTPQEVPALGITASASITEERITRLPLGQAFVGGLTATGGIIVQTFTVPIEVIRKAIPAEVARPVGPAGIYQITDSAVKAAQRSNVIYPILFVMAILSTALGVTNLLPIPALDGGRIMFIIIEAIRGKRVPPEREGAIHLIGLMLLLALMLVISYYDVTSPVDVSGIFR